MEKKKPKFVSGSDGIVVEDAPEIDREEDERRREELKEKKRQKEYEEACKQHSGPPITFTNFVISVSTATLVHFGEIADPVSGKQEKNLFLARQNIDLLGMLKEKTKGNLDRDEERLVDDALFKLRMRYIELCKQERTDEKEKDRGGKEGESS